MRLTDANCGGREAKKAEIGKERGRERTIESVDTLDSFGQEKGGGMMMMSMMTLCDWLKEAFAAVKLPPFGGAQARSDLVLLFAQGAV